MKNKIKLAILIIVIISSLFILTWCTSSVSETEGLFVKISDEQYFYIVYQKDTKVMYSVSNWNYNRGNLTLLVDTEGKPLLYEGE